MSDFREGSKVELHAGHGRNVIGKIVKLYEKISGKTKRKVQCADVEVSYKDGAKNASYVFAGRHVANLRRAS